MDFYPRGMQHLRPPRLREVLDMDDLSVRSESEVMACSSLDNTYQTLPVTQGMVHAASFQGLGLSLRNMSVTSLQFETIRASMKEECRKLEATNGRLRCFYNVVVTGCVLVGLVYLATVVYLYVALPSAQVCVQKEEVLRYKDIWDRMDRDDILQIFANSSYTSSGTTFCFYSLKWVPDMMAKIHTATEKSVNFIRGRQNAIQKTVNHYLQSNNTCDAGNKSSEMDPVFAHLCLNQTGVSRGVQRLQWTADRTKGFSRHNVDLVSVASQLNITHSGFYFLYSRLACRHDVTSTQHRVLKETWGQRQTLLQSRVCPTSSLQGVFMLTQGDLLAVEAEADHINMDSGQRWASYFGLYLIRT